MEGNEAEGNNGDIGDGERDTVQCAQVAINRKLEELKMAIHTKIDELDERYGSTVSGMHAMLHRLSRVNTASQWEIFLHSMGTDISLCIHQRAAVRVPPVGTSRSQPGVGTGSKRCSSGRLPLLDVADREGKRSKKVALNSIEQNQPNATSHGE